MQSFKIISFLSFIIFSITACNNNDPNANNKKNTSENHEIVHQKVKVNDSDIQSFIPKAYQVIYQTKGDANLDGKEDVLLVLAIKDEAKKSDFENGKPSKRMTILLLGTDSGGYEMKWSSDNLVECIDCSGLVADAFQKITIESNGDIKLFHEVMNQQYWTEIRTFSFKKPTDTWELSKDYFVSYRDDKQTGNVKAMKVGHKVEESSKEFGKIAIEQFDIYGKNRR